MRELVGQPRIGKFTQGAIFSCLRINGAEPAKGLVISARCDIAHSKSKTVLTLPVFTLNRWIATIGVQECTAQAGKTVEQLASDVLVKYGLAKKSFEIYGYDRTVEALKAKRIVKNDFDKLNSFRQYLNEKKFDPTIKQFKEAHNKLLDSLWRNTRADTHFIERTNVDEPAVGYVVDFTQPITQYRDVLDELSFGLERYKYARDTSGKYSNLDFGEEEQAEIISVLQSPYIEHILQRFTHYYSRIGTKDIALSDLNILKGRYEIV
ncbi:MAG: hypothetical protein C0490_26195 [Marivirga sp.]|nr:hypothetical protein [Marivirga sp.]